MHKELKNKVGIIDYGMGNLRSVFKAFQRIGQDPFVSEKAEELKRADFLVLPGVGHFRKGMANLKEKGLISFLKDINNYPQKKLLGICLGMQLLTEFSEEGNVEGLGMVRATTKKFPDFNNVDLKVPHMGWNQVNFTDGRFRDKKEGHPLFYFVHSYFVDCEDNALIHGQTKYGIEFISVISRNNIMGVQFHPEKSRHSGLTFLQHWIGGE